MLFPSRYLDDRVIWQRISQLQQQRQEISAELANPDVSTDPRKMPALAKQLDRLEPIARRAEELEQACQELDDAEQFLRDEVEYEHAALELFEEQQWTCQQRAAELFTLPKSA